MPRPGSPPPHPDVGRGPPQPGAPLFPPHEPPVVGPPLPQPPPPAFALIPAGGGGGALRCCSGGLPGGPPKEFRKLSAKMASLVVGGMITSARPRESDALAERTTEGGFIEFVQGVPGSRELDISNIIRTKWSHPKLPLKAHAARPPPRRASKSARPDRPGPRAPRDCFFQRAKRRWRPAGKLACDLCGKRRTSTQSWEHEAPARSSACFGTVGHLS